MKYKNLNKISSDIIYRCYRIKNEKELHRYKGAFKSDLFADRKESTFIFNYWTVDVDTLAYQ